MSVRRAHRRPSQAKNMETKDKLARLQKYLKRAVDRETSGLTQQGNKIKELASRLASGECSIEYGAQVIFDSYRRWEMAKKVLEQKASILADMQTLAEEVA
jgi:hypothetical protein